MIKHASRLTFKFQLMLLVPTIPYLKLYNDQRTKSQKNRPLLPLSPIHESFGQPNVTNNKKIFLEIAIMYKIMFPQFWWQFCPEN